MEENLVASPLESAEPATAHRSVLDLAFTGSGSEYFRIWIVNLLLTLCTLGLYYPWAKVRKLRYFYGNTLVGGEPLGFHGDPKKMFKGYVLVAILFACYSAAGKFSPTAGLVALLLVAAVWPALLKSSMQFRLANTSWRGLRFRFAGSLAGAYKAVLPLWLPVGLLLAFGAVQGPGSTPPKTLPADQVVVLLVLVFGSVSLWPLLLWNLKKYQHTHYALGTEQTTFSASLWSFYKLSLKLLALYVGSLLPIVIATGAAVAVGHVLSNGKGAMTLALLVAVPVYLLLFVGIYIYAQARSQDLVWSHTASRHAQFQSQLRFSALYWLTLKNGFFMVVTLGLYWPFAAVATRRLRLQAITVALSVAPEQLVAAGASEAGDTAGDAAGDFLGFDIGL